MEVIKRFENKLGYAEIQKYDNCYVEVIHSDFARISHFNEYRFKQDAIRTFQFDCQWLKSNEHTIVEECL